MKMKKEIKIKNQVGELVKVNAFIEEIGEELQLDMELLMNLNLVMEEMVSNVIFYAYPEGKTADIELSAECNGRELTFVLSDKGREFDPTMQDDADTDNSNNVLDSMDESLKNDCIDALEGCPVDAIYKEEN